MLAQVYKDERVNKLIRTYGCLCIRVLIRRGICTVVCSYIRVFVYTFVDTYGFVHT